MSAPRPRRRAALFVIAGLLAASGLVRIGAGTGQALAREFEELTAVNSAPAAPAECPAPPELGALLAALEARETRIVAAEEALADRMQALALAERKIEENLAALTEAEAALADTMAYADRAAEDDLTRLTSVYEAMKPKEAAALFETMEPDFAAGFLGRMRPDAAAAIFAGLSPEMAYTISVVLAGRNANAPTE